MKRRRLAVPPPLTWERLYESVRLEREQACRDYGHAWNLFRTKCRRCKYRRY